MFKTSLIVSSLSSVPVAELDSWYSLFKRVTLVNPTSVGDTVDFAQLCEFMTAIGTPWWQRIRQDNQLKIMKQLKSKDVVDSVPRLGFHPLVAGLWPWLNGDLPARFDGTPDIRLVLNFHSSHSCSSLFRRPRHRAQQQVEP